MISVMIRSASNTTLHKNRPVIIENIEPSPKMTQPIALHDLIQCIYNAYDSNSEILSTPNFMETERTVTGTSDDRKTTCTFKVWADEEDVNFASIVTAFEACLKSAQLSSSEIVGYAFPIPSTVKYREMVTSLFPDEKSIHIPRTSKIRFIGPMSQYVCSEIMDRVDIMYELNRMCHKDGHNIIQTWYMIAINSDEDKSVLCDDSLIHDPHFIIISSEAISLTRG